MKYISIICVRGGSKGFPKKNIHKLNGKSLLARAIEIAKDNKKISRVIVSTDSQEFASIALENGAEVPFMRPSELAEDGSPEWLVWRHAIEYLENDGETNFSLVVLPVTAPLRNTSDVDRCIEEFESSEADSVITVTEANRSPYFNMVNLDNNGYSSLVIKPRDIVTRRQDAPEVFDMTTIAFIVSASFVKLNNNLFEGKVRSVMIPKERSIDIDTPYDMEIAEFLAKKLEGAK
jgi:CMP-N-acetylneuraminic acid synthetase|tara:strand:+ start:132 stop:833 length:702 start_codon:yes stop_codon:yes gene_type:complete